LLCVATSPAPLILTPDPLGDSTLLPELPPQDLGSRCLDLARPRLTLTLCFPLPFLFPPARCAWRSNHPISIPSDKSDTKAAKGGHHLPSLHPGQPSPVSALPRSTVAVRASWPCTRPQPCTVAVPQLPPLELRIVPQTAGAQARRPANPPAPHPQDAHERLRLHACWWPPPATGLI